MTEMMCLYCSTTVGVHDGICQHCYERFGPARDADEAARNKDEVMLREMEGREWPELAPLPAGGYYPEPEPELVGDGVEGADG
jgi:hypothetical protein